MRFGVVSALFATGLLLAAATEVRASQYQAWGDSGWGYASKRECCNAAIAIAQEYSAQACLDTGGQPRPPMGAGQRGVCTSEWSQAEDGSLLYRCYAEAALWCR
jgi:hypothetical protein